MKIIYVFIYIYWKDKETQGELFSWLKLMFYMLCNLLLYEYKEPSLLSKIPKVALVSDK